MATDKKYFDFVQSLAMSRDNRMFLSSDEDKAVIVLSNLFRISEEEVRIFDGNLCKPDVNQSEYIIALSDFIERGGKLSVLLNKYDPDIAKSSNLFKRLSYLKAQGKPIIVKSTQANPYIETDDIKMDVHFTLGDKKSFRIETDFVKRTAVCNFNFPKIAIAAAEFFDSMFISKDAVEIDIENLFENGDK